MKFCWILLISVFIFGELSSQEIFNDWNRNELAAHLQFLSSDELMGRNTGEIGGQVAARYIAVQFEQFGVKPLPGMDSYFQEVPFAQVTPQDHSVTWNGEEYDQGESFLALSEHAYVGELETVFAKHAMTEEDYTGLDVEGKIIIALTGDGDTKSPQAAFGMRNQKIELAKEKGALGLIELFTIPMPWNMLVGYMNRPRLQLDESENTDEQFFSGLINLDKGKIGEMASGNAGKIMINYPGLQKEGVQATNVIGYIEGTDETLKEDYILLSAHYDHVGTGRSGTNADTIFNGARDNALGVVAVLSAVQALSANPPKRSVIFAAWTAEEKGLLGSRYFVNHAPISLDKIKFNLNSDGAGYDDTTAISVLGLHRVGAEAEMLEAANAMGLTVIADPAPEQNLFDRSDNVNFAAEGIPAPTFSPGTTGFTKEIIKYYHQPNDQFDSIDLNYVNKFWKAFVLSAQLIGNKDEDPQWIEGDKYEEAAKKLYNKE